MILYAEQVCHDPPVSADELVAIYDSTGAEIGSAPRSVMRAEGLWHACASVLVLSGDRQRVYVHRRVEDKDIFPGAHDCWAGGVMAPGERPEDCARRELAEELGVVGVAIEPLFTARFPDPPLRNHTHAYQTCWDGPVVHQPEEIAVGWWMSIDELRAKLTDPDWLFVPDGQALIEEWLRHYH